MVAKASGYRLSDKDASIVLAMLARGDRAHDVSAFFGVNPARVFDVRDQKGAFAGRTVPVAQPHDLPPTGAPGPKGRRLREAVANVATMLLKSDVDGAR